MTEKLWALWLGLIHVEAMRVISAEGTNQKFLSDGRRDKIVFVNQNDISIRNQTIMVFSKEMLMKFRLLVVLAFFRQILILFI